MLHRISILLSLFAFGCSSPHRHKNDCSPLYDHGAIVRGDTTKKSIALVFTGHEFGDGGEHIRRVLTDEKVKASFFFTGDFYRNEDFRSLVDGLNVDGHYLGGHSDKHLLYCDWNMRDSLLINRDEFTSDINNNQEAMRSIGLVKAQYFLPPYEWYNDTISAWTASIDLTLINMTHGTLSHADYTTPDMSNYRSSDVIYHSIIDHESKSQTGLNGFMLLSHIGTSPGRHDKFYMKLEGLIEYLKVKGYEFRRVDELLECR